MSGFIAKRESSLLFLCEIGQSHFPRVHPFRKRADEHLAKSNAVVVNSQRLFSCRDLGFFMEWRDGGKRVLRGSQRAFPREVISGTSFGSYERYSQCALGRTA